MTWAPCGRASRLTQGLTPATEAAEAIAAARAEGRVVIMAGDFNSDVTASGKYSVKYFLDEADLVHAGSQCFSFIRHKEWVWQTSTDEAGLLAARHRGSVISDIFPVLYDIKHIALHLPVVGKYTAGGQPPWRARRSLIWQTAAGAQRSPG